MDGWRPSSDGQGGGHYGAPRPAEGALGPSEKMVVPSFSGNTNDDGEVLPTTGVGVEADDKDVQGAAGPHALPAPHRQGVD